MELILTAPGTNRADETAAAIQAVGGQPTILPGQDLYDQPDRLFDFSFLILPGGFSYGDALGAGRLWALELDRYLGDSLRRFAGSGRPVLGICNGFQTLLHLGLLPNCVSLVPNDSGQFVCRWVWLNPVSSQSLFTRRIIEPIYLPVAHAEGRVVAWSRVDLCRLRQLGQVPFLYQDNPNGSWGDVAALTNAQGNVMGMMPHPEDAIWPDQHPHHLEVHGREIFRAGVEAGRHWDEVFS